MHHSRGTSSILILPELRGPDSADRSDYLERNRQAWDRWARDYSAAARRAWTVEELQWGIWELPESELQVLASLPAGSDIIELGCGSAAISAHLAGMGMRPVAVDISREQLNTAERLQREFDVSFPLVYANAEAVPFDTDSFDMAISEYGASLWCEPRTWLVEANRLLRSGGLLVFVINSPLLMLCTPLDGDLPSNQLVRDHFSEHRVVFPADGAVEFHLTHGQWIELLRSTGFSIEKVLELRAPHGATPRQAFVSNEWARRWPSEEIWIARKSE